MKRLDIAFGYDRINSELMSPFEFVLAITKAEALLLSTGFLRSGRRSVFALRLWCQFTTRTQGMCVPTATRHWQ